MLPDIDKIKGVHPGAVLVRELKNKGLESKQFALSIGEHPQTINAISKGRRGINPALSVKLGNALGTGAAYFMILQAYYEVENERRKLVNLQPVPDLSKFREVIFWDTDMSKIDWENQKKAVIKRIFERGNDIEIQEIIAFYGRETILQNLSEIEQYLPSLTENVNRFIHQKL